MQSSINQGHADNGSDEQLEKMDQDNESSPPSIHELLSLLVEKTESIEATLSAVLASQNQRDEILRSVSQTLGIGIETPSITAHNGNSSNNSITKRGTVRDMTRPLAAATSRAITSRALTIQNKSQTESSISTKYSTKRHRHQQHEIPSKFITSPRPRLKINVTEAIYSLAKSPTEGEKMMTFLNDNVNRVVQKVYRKAASNQPDLGGKRADQDENVRKEAMKWLIQTAANYKPSIPLTKCKDDWIIKYFFPRRYNDFIYQEKKRIQKQRQERQRELQQLKRKNSYYASSDMTELSSSESSQKSGDDNEDDTNDCSASEKSDEQYNSCSSNTDDITSTSSTRINNSVSFKNNLFTVPDSTSIGMLGRSSSSIALSNTSSFDFDLMKCEVFALGRARSDLR